MDLSLAELVGPEALARLRETLAVATGMSVAIRGPGGQAIVPISPARGADDPADAAATPARLVEPVELDGACLGYLEVQGPTASDQAAELLRAGARLLGELCRRGRESGRRLRELATLADTSALLTQTTDLQGRLDILTRAVTEALGVKGCLIRLLDHENGELVVKSVYNLSRRYLEKGPVNLSDSVVDQEAILGRVVYSRNVTSDPRMLYPREAAEEGLASMLCVALRTKERVIGTIRVYTAKPHEFTAEEVSLFRAIANQAAAAIENAALYEEALRAQALDKELAAAAQIQRHLMPTESPSLRGFEIASRYIPFGLVGGDLYDFVPIENQHLGIVIADVAGKGVPAAILMAATRAALRGHIETVYAARDIIAKTNRVLCRDIAQDQFVTLFYGALDTVGRRFTYCNAGHIPPLLFRDGRHCELSEGGLVLGLDPGAAYEERQFVLRHGDVLLFYTDGLTETMNPEGETFGRGRLVEAVVPHLGESAGEILDRVWHASREFARGAAPRDDFTIIVLKVL